MPKGRDSCPRPCLGRAADKEQKAKHLIFYEFLRRRDIPPLLHLRPTPHAAPLSCRVMLAHVMLAHALSYARSTQSPPLQSKKNIKIKKVVIKIFQPGQFFAANNAGQEASFLLPYAPYSPVYREDTRAQEHPLPPAEFLDHDPPGGPQGLLRKDIFCLKSYLATKI